MQDYWVNKEMGKHVDLVKGASICTITYTSNLSHVIIF